MNSAALSVLLAGDTPAKSKVIRNWLNKMGCSFRVVASYEEACSQLARSVFDLVLCNYRLSDRTAFPLLDWLEGSDSSLVFCATSGRKSRWLPMIERGERRLDRPTIGAATLPATLEQLLNGRSHRPSTRSAIPVRSRPKR